ncbi:hypothetical protein AVEN_267503-1 [Araneus ventricosus]|uniref:Uncharacterized protein n=1 Tax=Araneus ventricosus TaxID=182803 RepID=A0A4Y2VCH3_ARAVE|nr:hypothetical protein AVEN_233056-1 [Araneus ventricosus]GBO22987.1 hypothetical protein AVEN_267503-1 [Araneus ventricosus]
MCGFHVTTVHCFGEVPVADRIPPRAAAPKLLNSGIGVETLVFLIDSCISPSYLGRSFTTGLHNANPVTTSHFDPRPPPSPISSMNHTPRVSSPHAHVSTPAGVDLGPVHTSRFVSLSSEI